MMFSQFTFLWILFAVVDSHSPLTEKKTKDGISVKSEIVISNLQNQINQETVIRLSLMRQVYSLVNDMITVKNEMAAMKTNAGEKRKSTDDLRDDDNEILSDREQMKLDLNDTSESLMKLQHEHNKMLSDIEQMKHDHNDTSESIKNAQYVHNEMLSEIEKVKLDHNDTSESIKNAQHVHNKMLSEIEKVKLDHNDTLKMIINAQREHYKKLSEIEQRMEIYQNDTSKKIGDVHNYLLHVYKSVGNLRNYTDRIKAMYDSQANKIIHLSIEQEKIQTSLVDLHKEDKRILNGTQRTIANHSEYIIEKIREMRDDLERNITLSILYLIGPSIRQECLESSDCWLQYSFKYDNSWNGCEGGTQYVKKTKYSSAPYLGVMACSSTRYKLFLGKTLTGRYYNIADRAGSGEDHCELLGTNRNGVVPEDYEKSPNTQGFFRSKRGGTFSFDTIGYTPTDTNKWYEKWIECGVNIPGNDRVVTEAML